jgi:cold shock CspA family protein
MRGTVGKVIAGRGYGFIVAEGDGKEVFFHRSELKGTRFEEMSTGLPVQFDLALDPRNPRRFRAVRVERLGGA